MEDQNVWELLSAEPKEPVGVMTDAFIIKYNRYLNFYILSAHYDFSPQLLRIYIHRVHWPRLLKRMKFSESFLREMANSSAFSTKCWAVLSEYQTLSKEFIYDFAYALDWNNIVQHQNVCRKFLADIADRF